MNYLKLAFEIFFSHLIAGLRKSTVLSTLLSTYLFEIWPILKKNYLIDFNSYQFVETAKVGHTFKFQLFFNF